jgi:hypothetical protein
MLGLCDHTFNIIRHGEEEAVGHPLTDKEMHAWGFFNTTKYLQEDAETERPWVE